MKKKCEIKKGKILRVKQGYNPNSSSMGSIVYILPAALLGITTGFGVISGIILAALMTNKNEKISDKEQE